MEEFKFSINYMKTSNGKPLSLNPDNCLNAKYKIDDYLTMFEPLSPSDYSEELKIPRPVRDRVSSEGERFRDVRNYTQVFLDKDGFVVVFETGLKEFGELSFPIPLSMRVYSFNEGQNKGEEIKKDLETIIANI